MESRLHVSEKKTKGRASQETKILIKEDSDAEDEAEEAVFPMKKAAMAAGLFSAAGLLAWFRYAGAGSTRTSWMETLPENVPGSNPSPAHGRKGNVLINAVRLLGIVHPVPGTESSSSSALAASGAPALSGILGNIVVPDHRMVAHNDAQAFHPSDLVYAGQAVGKPHAEMISNDEKAAEIALIKKLSPPHLTDAGPYLSEPEQRVRVPRNAADTGVGEIDEGTVKERIAAIFADQDKFSENMREELSIIWNEVQDSDDYQYAFEHENIVFLKLAIILITDVKNAHVQDNPEEVTESYHYLDKAQRELWKIVGHLSDELREQFFDDFIRLRQGVIWEKNNEDMLPGDWNTLFAEYTASQHPKWYKKKIHDDSLVVIHREEDLSLFSVRELFDAEHASFIRDVSWSAHFDFDSLGYPDDELRAFVSQAGEGWGEQFMIPPALRLLEARYRQIGASPLYFDKLENIPVVVPQSAMTGSLQVLSTIDPQQLATEVVERLLLAPEYTLAVTSALAFARTLVVNMSEKELTGFDATRLLEADYIYQYQDSYGRTRQDTATLVELLSRNRELESLAVSRRAQVRIMWPVQFSPALIAHLETLSKLVDTYSDKLKTSLLLANKRQQLQEKIPDLASEVKKSLKQICRSTRIIYCKPDTKVLYRFTTKVRPSQATPENHDKEFTLFEILLGQKRRWEEDPSIGAVRLSEYRGRPPMAQHKALLEKIENFKIQEHVIGQIQTLLQDAAVKKDFDEYIDLLESTLQYRGPAMKRIYYYEIPSLIFYFHPGRYWNTSKVEVLSITTAERFSFRSTEAMMKQLKQDKYLNERIMHHFPEYLRERINFDSPFSRREFLKKNEMFDAFMNWKVIDTDKYVRSHGEAEWNTVINWVTQHPVEFAAPAIMLGPVGAVVYGAAMTGGPLLLKAAASDDPEEQMELMKQAILLISLEVLAARAFYLLGKRIANSVRAYRNVPEALLIGTKKMLGMVKRTLAKAKVNFSYNLRTVQTLFPGRIKRLLIDQGKPAALLKLQNAKSVLKDPLYKEQVETGARFYFGKDYQAASFQKKIDEITKGFDRLEKVNIDVQVASQAKSGNVAALDYGLFKTGETTDKFLKVQKNGFDTYYRETGKSNSALADVLIHEISHGTSKTKDYVYIGSVKGGKGNVDVVELMKLGNKKLTVRQGKISSPFSGDDFNELRDTRFYDVGNPAAINADSTAQYISYLDKARTNPAQFSAERVKMQSALGNIEHAGEMGAIFLQRSKRAISQDSESAHHETTVMASRYLLVMDDAAGAKVYELADLKIA